ncbi:MAG: LPS assembly lipoprotein LptE [Elusimicrobiota bacterium]|jgi:outer membrane lipopolysaccharide assembly protein LptE/RlpB|nr:LPS assembly lipoprotein LptE [Elusimicrobiota bacterium]
MRKHLLFLFVFVFFLAFVGCLEYSAKDNSYSMPAKKIFIRAVQNNTNQYGLEANLTVTLSDEALNDSRVSFVNSEYEADGILSIVIRRYILRPLTYDANMAAEQYKMWVVTEVSMTNAKDNVEMWKENMEAIHIYLDSDKSSSGKESSDAVSEQDARTAAWEKLSRRIIRRIVKGYQN